MKSKTAMHMERIEFRINQIVFAKQKGYVHWPGIILDLHPTRNRCARVEFFGWNSQWAYISFNNLLHRYAAQEIIAKNHNNAKFQRAICEMNIWLEGNHQLLFETIEPSSRITRSRTKQEIIEQSTIECSKSPKISKNDANQMTKRIECIDKDSMTRDSSNPTCSKEYDTHNVELVQMTKNVIGRNELGTKDAQMKSKTHSGHTNGRMTRSKSKVMRNDENSTKTSFAECSKPLNICATRPKTHSGHTNGRMTRSKSKVMSNDENSIQKSSAECSKTLNICATRPKKRSDHTNGRMTRSKSKVMSDDENSIQTSFAERSKTLNICATRSKSKEMDESGSLQYSKRRRLLQEHN